jgi:putative endonuclease
VSRTLSSADWPPPDRSHLARGRWGEDRAAARLRSLGFAIVDRNWRSPDRELPGELDLVARRGDLVVFCEVKARRRVGRAVWAVDEVKQGRLRALAAAWLRAHELGGAVDVRFDVIAIEGVRLDHYESAF